MEDALIAVVYLLGGFVISCIYTILADGGMMHFCIVMILGPAIACFLIQSFKTDRWMGFCVLVFSAIPIAMRFISIAFRKSGDMEIAAEIFYYRYLVCVPIGVFCFLLFTLGTFIDHMESPRVYHRRKN